MIPSSSKLLTCSRVLSWHFSLSSASFSFLRVNLHVELLCCSFTFRRPLSKFAATRHCSALQSVTQNFAYQVHLNAISSPSDVINLTLEFSHQIRSNWVYVRYDKQTFCFWKFDAYVENLSPEHHYYLYFYGNSRWQFSIWKRVLFPVLNWNLLAEFFIKYLRNWLNTFTNSS
jgi:hypothetical protein